MNRRKKLITILLALVLIGVLTFFNFVKTSDFINGETQDTLSKLGSRGPEVTEIQRRLKKWHYYFGNVDGIYGKKTRAAVIKFQKKYGLVADGIAGPQTLRYMGIPSSSGSYSTNQAQSNINLLARVINGEARGEPYRGQVAVGAVVLNRTRDSRFPKTIASVIYQPGAFDAVSDGQINLPPSQTAINAARDAINGWDPSYGSIYYFNPATATNKWIWSRPLKIVIGRHRFCG